MHWTDIQRVSEENELSVLFLVPVDDASYLVGILLSGLLAIHIADAIREDTRTWREPSGPFHGFEVICLLASNHEVSANAFDVMKPFEVIVATIKDVEGVLLIRDYIHRVHVVNPGFRYVKECWNLRFKVIQRVNFDTAFSLILSENGPFERLQAQFYGC